MESSRGPLVIKTASREEFLNRIRILTCQELILIPDRAVQARMDAGALDYFWRISFVKRILDFFGDVVLIGGARRTSVCGRRYVAITPYKENV